MLRLSRCAVRRCGGRAAALALRGNRRPVSHSIFGEPRKSASCYGVLSGEPLTEYPNHEAALDGARYTKYRSGRRLGPYHCSKCGQWHLAPEERMIDITKCLCVSASGEPKSLFKSERDAQRRADILRRERGADLGVYRCEYGWGWHLTRSWR